MPLAQAYSKLGYRKRRSCPRRSTDHEAVDIVRIHQGRELPLLSGTAQHQPLCAWEAFPFRHSAVWKGRSGRSLDFPLRGPAGGAVLAVTHSFTLDAVQAARPEKVVMATRAPNTTASRRISIQVSLFTAVISLLVVKLVPMSRTIFDSNRYKITTVTGEKSVSTAWPPY